MAGALASALAAGAVWGLSLLGLFFLAVPVTLGHAVFLGLPAALYFRRRGWMHVLAAVVGGFLIGALPIGLLLVGLTLSGDTPTTRGLLASLEIAGTAGALGAPGGLAFWFTLRAFGEFR